MSKLNILAVSDGEHSSGTTVLKNVAKHSKHNIDVVQWHPGPYVKKDHDIIYIHLGSLLCSERWDKASGLRGYYEKHKNEHYKWLVGVTGWSCLYAMLVPVFKDGGRYRFQDYIHNKEIPYMRVPSLEMKQVVEFIDPEIKAFTCHSGVDTDFFLPSKPPTDFTIGWAGNPATYQKMYNNFLKLPFLKVTAKGGSPIQEMPNFYRKISVYVSTSIKEGSPLPPKEAAACGRPIVALKTGDLAEWVPEEWMVDPHDERWKNWNVVPYRDDIYYKKLIPLIEKLRDDRNLYYNECKRFREIALKWDFKNIAKEYDHMFESVIKGEGKNGL